MASPFFDAIKASVSSAPGTGAITVGPLISGFRAFSNVPANTIVNYRADDTSGWEQGSGLWNGTTLTRGLKYSSTGSLLSLTANALISLIIPADEVQPHIGGGKWGLISAVAGSATLSSIGASFTAIGTASSPAIATTNYLTRQHRVTLTSSAAASSGAGYTLPSAMVSVSQTAFSGGFEFVCRTGVLTIAAAVDRLQVGVAAATTVTGNPSALLNSALFGVDVADTNIFFMSNDGSGTATRVDTTIAFAANAFYEFAIWANPGERKMYWSIARLDTGTSSSGVVTATADIPANDTLLIPQVQISTAAQVTAVALAFQSLYLRSSF